MGRNLLAAQHCSGQWPVRTAARLCTVRACGPLAETTHGLPAGKTCDARARIEAVTALWAHVTVWPAAALPWLRWARWGARASTLEGSPTRQVGEGGSSPEPLAEGGCSGGQRGPTSGWEGRGSLGAGVPGEKGGKGCARVSAHRGVGHDGGGGPSSGDRVAHGELLHRWGEGGEGQ
jgi:hypothetical protein